jgi:hypothetical protein
MGIPMIDADNGNEPLELTEDQEVAFADEAPEQVEAEPEEETVIAFADEGEDVEDDTPVVRRLRDQLRQTQRQLRQVTRAPVQSDDPEPVIPARPSLESVDYDQDKFDELSEKREKAILERAAWERRNEDRERDRKRQEEDQVKHIEQQKRSLGVSDYDARAEAVRERLTDAQMAVLLNGADNAVKLIYALGRSDIKLSELASIDNLAKFAARVGQLERDIKVTKKQPPAPQSRVRGATASTAVTSDAKYLEQLEREADRTGDRSKIVAYNRQLRQNAA